MSANKYYIVWEGHQPGIYDTWEECQRQIQHFSRPKYKSFKGITQEEAERLFSEGAISTSPLGLTVIDRCQEIDLSALAVDASTIGNPGPMEYRGVWVETGDILFSSKIYPVGTNNIGEFLAIVHAMAWMKQHNYIVPIYSDSLTAMYWARKGKPNTKLALSPETKELHNVLQRATNWLSANDLSPYKLMKWETDQWGEIPADYGRK